MSEVKYPSFGKRYKHYKGGEYEFICLAPHTETEEILVIYKSLLFGSYHARPLDSWNEPVAGRTNINRFEIMN